MSGKTAVMQLIEIAENHTGIVTRQFWIEQAKSLLPVEREQIEAEKVLGIVSALVQLLSSDKDVTIAQEIFKSHGLTIKEIKRSGATKEDVDLITERLCL